MEAVVRYIEDEYPTSTSLVEVGVGRRDETARQLAEAGYDMTVTDVLDVSDSVADSVRFVRDDVRHPDRTVYENSGLVYALRPPYEIHAAVSEVALSVGADLLLAPLADEGVSVEARLVNRDGRAFFVRRSDGGG